MKMKTAKGVAAVLVAVVVLGGATVVNAQMYYPDYTYTGGSYAGECTALTKDLAIGLRGSEVLALQRFIVAQNYPGAGSWMVTGYFGNATAQGVRNFQQQSGVFITGSVDYATRTAIQNRSCGYGYTGYSYNYPSSYNYSYPYNYTLPVIPAPVYPSCTWCTTPQAPLSISYLSPASGGVGTAVTVYGAGLTTDGNTAHFGNGIITNLRSFDGHAISFTVPSTLIGYSNQPTQLATYDLYVTNSRGENSNKLQFAVTSLAPIGVRPSITGVSGPTSLAAGTQGTWTITLTAPTNTYVTLNATWGDENLYGYAAQQAAQSIYVTGTQTYTFTHAYYTQGSYTPTFTATNTAGSNSASASVNVSGYGSGTGTSWIRVLEPAQAQKGALIAIQGTGFSATDNTVHFGIGGMRNMSSINGGTTIYYTVPHHVSVCDLVVGSCAAPVTVVDPGTFPIYVTNASGNSNTVNFTVVQ